MTRKEILIGFFKKTVLTVVIAYLLFTWGKILFSKGDQPDYFLIWVFCGIPFGIRRMWVWVVPFGHDLAATAGIIALDFIVGGLIGGVVLVWRLLVAAWYIPLTIYRLLTAGKGGDTKFHIEE